MRELFELFFVFFKLGLFTFGGGYAMIPQLKKKVVEDKKWVNEDEMLEIITISQSMPGPIAVNMATYIGYNKKGFMGSIFSLIGIVLPSLIIIFLITLVFEEFMTNVYVQYAFTGIKCAVSVLIIWAAIGMYKKSEKKLFFVSLFIIVTSLVVLFEIFSVNFSSIYLILIGGILGILINTLNKVKEEEK